MIAKSAFTSMRKVLTSRDIYMTVRIKVLRCDVWSTLLYGCETWTICVAMQKKTGSIRNMALQNNIENILEGHGYQ